MSPRFWKMAPARFPNLAPSRVPAPKLLSISGDCTAPGIYEVEFGVSLRQVLEMAGADQAQAVQVGGPSGELVGTDQFDRILCFDDLATGGSIMVFNQSREHPRYCPCLHGVFCRGELRLLYAVPCGKCPAEGRARTSDGRPWRTGRPGAVRAGRRHDEGLQSLWAGPDIVATGGHVAGEFPLINMKRWWPTIPMVFAAVLT